jgi:hypothetical protein
MDYTNFNETIKRDPSSLNIRTRRNKRRVRHGFIDTYMMLNRIRRLPPQNTNDPFINQLFNGSTFR